MSSLENIKQIGGCFWKLDKTRGCRLQVELLHFGASPIGLLAESAYDKVTFIFNKEKRRIVMNYFLFEYVTDAKWTFIIIFIWLMISARKYSESYIIR